MKTRTGTKCCLMAMAVCTAWLAGVSLVHGEIDFGDHGSATLTEKAWNSLASQDVDAVLAYADKCISLYEAEAKTMQASLTAFPSSEPKEETTRYWALNDVGTCYFIKGQALLIRSDRQGAKAAFEKCANEFGYSQCWDPKGWFWKPADAARQKLVELTFDDASAAPTEPAATAPAAAEGTHP